MAPLNYVYFGFYAFPAYIWTETDISNIFTKFYFNVFHLSLFLFPISF